MIDFWLKIVFWISAGLLIYVYIGYPVVLHFFSRWFPLREKLAPFALPRVSLLISAYNERGVISKKLDNSLGLDYPRELLEILVVSDASNDGTDELINKYAEEGVRLVRQSERLGKSSGLNLGVSAASGEVLLFSDANAMYKTDAIGKLVSHFADAKVGYVVGNARYLEQGGLLPSAECEGIYWKLETWLKQRESQFGSVVGGDGAIYAIRRDLYFPLRPTDINDLLNPLQIIARGYRGVYEPEAVCYEEAGESFQKEFHRKARIVGRSLNAVWRAAVVLRPWTQPRHWFALVSHKLLRWFAPVFLPLSLAASLCLWHSVFYRVAAILQMAFYVLALGGYLAAARSAVPRLLHIPYYFCVVNLASLLGVSQFFRGRLSPTWKTIRQESDESQPIRDARAHLAKR
jgi:cellulose synthase/poly-beta-1,6-N-acetylglucosamine synthase-like glycosyltransferase